MYIPKSGSSVWTAITNGFRLTDAASQDICDITHSSSITYFKGADASGDDFKLFANRTDTYPTIELIGNSYIYYKAAAGSFHYFRQGNTDICVMVGTLNRPALGIKECTTSPVTLTGYGQLYTKSDNELYFKDGDGTEYTINKT